VAPALHPDFGFFGLSPGFRRKLSIAVRVIAVAAVAGTLGFRALFTEDEPEAGRAFAFAPPEATRQLADTGWTGGVFLRSGGTAERVRAPVAVMQPSQLSIPKVIRVHRKRITPFEPNIAREQ
jgi:hypothetical protein